MDASSPEPDIGWYLRISQERGVTPRCPFASVERCPRYFHSLSLLGRAGFTKISPAEEARLDEFWKASDLLPRTDEGETLLVSSNGHVHLYANFCPEVTNEGFGFFASLLADFSDEIDRDAAHRQLSRNNAARGSWRWRWAGLAALHFTECPLYSPLLHDTTSRQVVDKKHAEKPEMLTLKPSFWGVSIDLKEIWRRYQSWWRSRRAGVGR
jgi:hypothetical protein